MNWLIETEDNHFSEDIFVSRLRMYAMRGEKILVLSSIEEAGDDAQIFDTNPIGQYPNVSFIYLHSLQDAKQVLNIINNHHYNTPIFAWNFDIVSWYNQGNCEYMGYLMDIIRSDKALHIFRARTKNFTLPETTLEFVSKINWNRIEFSSEIQPESYRAHLEHIETFLDGHHDYLECIASDFELDRDKVFLEKGNSKPNFYGAWCILKRNGIDLVPHSMFCTKEPKHPINQLGNMTKRKNLDL